MLRALREVVRAKSPNLVFFSERRLLKNNVESIHIALKFHGVFSVDRNGYGGV